LGYRSSFSVYRSSGSFVGVNIDKGFRYGMIYYYQ